MATEAGDVAKIARIKAEAELLGVDVLPPHINQSGITFQPRNQAIVFGLAAVKNVGEAAVEAIVEARENTGAFTSQSLLHGKHKKVCFPRMGMHVLIMATPLMRGCDFCIEDATLIKTKIRL